MIEMNISAVDAQEFTDEIPGYSACAYARAAGTPEGGSGIVDEAV